MQVYLFSCCCIFSCSPFCSCQYLKFLTTLINIISFTPPVLFLFQVLVMPLYLLSVAPVVVLRYVPPDQAKVVASVHASMSGSSASSTSSTPEVRPLKTLLGESAPALHLSRNTPSQVRTHTFGKWATPGYGFYADLNALLWTNSQIMKCCLISAQW